MGAIRDAAKNLGTPHLRGCVLYTSSEPCPMCMGAAYWARISKVFYATTVADVKKYGNFDDEDHYAELAKEPHDRDIPTLPFMREEAVEVWKEFHMLPDRCHY
jgi:tRNA(Arg) A34 adenosine deaminase TadA